VVEMSGSINVVEMSGDEWRGQGSIYVVEMSGANSFTRTQNLFSILGLIWLCVKK
jgi:hypothetical protein